MKRPLIIFSLLSCAALTSCAGSIPISTVSPELDVCFSAEAAVKYPGGECEAQIRRIKPGKWEFCITDPYPLEGLIITIENGVTRLAMFDMESAADVCGDTVSAARYISAAFEAAAKEGGSTVKDDSGYTFTGSCSYGGYTVGMDDRLSPVSLDIAEAGVHLEITKYGLLERDEGQAELE